MLRLSVSTVRSAFVLALVLLSAAAGCRRSTRTTAATGLEYGSASDVEKLLSTHGALVKVHDCENVRYLDDAGVTTRDGTHPGTTRALSCLTTLSPTQASAFSGSFGMTVLSKTLVTPGVAKSGECELRGFAVGAPGIEVWTVYGRAKSDGWDYVHLHYERATGRACVQTQYAWS